MAALGCVFQVIYACVSVARLCVCGCQSFCRGRCTLYHFDDEEAVAASIKDSKSVANSRCDSTRWSGGLNNKVVLKLLQELE